MVDAQPEYAQGRKNDERPLESSRKVFDLAVTIRVVPIGWLGRQQHTPQSEPTRYNVDDRLHGIGQDCIGAGQSIRIELDRHKENPHQQGNGDSLHPNV